METRLLRNTRQMASLYLELTFTSLIVPCIDIPVICAERLIAAPTLRDEAPQVTVYMVSQPSCLDGLWKQEIPKCF